MRTRRVAILLAVTGAIAVAAPPPGIWFNNRAEANLSHARDVRHDLDVAALGAINAETGLRGYILTGEDSFRAPYDQGMQQFYASLDDLGQSHPDMAASLRRLFDDWQSQSAEPRIELVAGGRRAEAATPPALASGKSLFDEFRAELDASSATVAREIEEAHDDERRADLIEAVLIGVGGLGLAAFAVILTRILIARRRHQDELRQVHHDLQREREMSGLRKELLSTASHELRNPLTGLLLSAQMLEEEAVSGGDAELASMAGDVVRSARRASDLAAELLDFTRMEAGVLNLTPEIIEPEQIVESALQDVRISHANAEIELDTHDAPAVNGDFGRLRLVVRNLLENAVRYGEKPVRVRITNGGPRVEIHVEDSGPGVPDGERERVFQRFQRGSNAGRSDGTGIGLYLSRGIVELHGGSLEVRPSPLGGADFVVALPRS